MSEMEINDASGQYGGEAMKEELVYHPPPVAAPVHTTHHKAAPKHHHHHHHQQQHHQQHHMMKLAVAPVNAECLPDDDTNLEELTDEMHEQRMADCLSRFWQQQAMEMEALEIGTEQDFKNHNDLPLARIKRIMKSDEDVRMISAEAPVLFAKACEIFILELTLRSNAAAEKSKRRTLQKEDVEMAIKNTPVFDFLENLPA